MKFNFPSGFLWGAATSSHQVEGNNTNNDWWQWEKEGCARGGSSGAACDHWRRYQEDFTLASTLGHTAHRFSLEWSRIEPEEGRFSSEALVHYEAMMAELRLQGIEPIVTLNHFTLPHWLYQKGGWLHPKAPKLFARYAKKVTGWMGNKVRYWMTLNEPDIYVYKSYVEGDWPPGEKCSYLKLAVVYLQLLRAHKKAYRKIHRNAKSEIFVGIAKSVAAFAPFSKDSLIDRISSKVSEYFNNHFFVQMSRAKKTLDFIGLNYYTRFYVQNFKIVPSPNLLAEKNSLSWEVYPKGIYEVVKSFCHYDLPIVISENGICTNDDKQREAFIHNHLSYLSQSIQEGAPVIGYLYWSLLDNFEWAEGFGPRFGIIEVDYKTQERRIRPSAYRLSEIFR